MKLLIVLLALLELVLAREFLYTPGYSYYPAQPGLTYARTGAVLPLAYTHLVAPLSQSHVYHSVQTPSSFQQQYRTDYKPLTYEYLY